LFAGGADFHLASSDTNAKDQGTKLSSDSDLAFSDDIDGHSRGFGSLWDIGADEYVDGKFEYRRQITIDRTRVSPCSSNPSHFPILIIESGNWVKTKATDAVNGRIYSSSGHDIVFRADDGVTQLDHEIEKYDGTIGILVAWVRIPSLNYSGQSQDTSIYMYYGNAGITSPTANPTGVWNTSYGWRGVWHLSEASSVTRSDSTSNANNLTQTGGVPLATGQIASAASFNGTSQYLSLTDAGQTGLDITGNITIEAWIRLAQVDAGPYSIAMKWRGTCASGEGPYMLRATDGDPGYEREGFTAYNTCGGTNQSALGSTSSMVAGTWHHLVGVYDGSNVRIYKNGSQTNSNPLTGTLYNSDGDFQVGIRGTSQWFNGLIDEIRVSAVDRDACWIGTEYKNQSNPYTFITLGSEGSAAPTVVTLKSFTVTQYSEGVLLRWNTGYEVNNLGFHIYREENGQLVRLTPEPVAGSALIVGSRTALTAGHHYHWWDFPSISTRPSSLATLKYWLKDIDLSGKETMHGPVTPVISREPIQDKQRPELLSERGMRLQERYHHYWRVQDLKEKIRSQGLRSAKGALRLRSSRTGSKIPLRTGPTGLEGRGFHRRSDPSANEVQRVLAGRAAVKLSVKEEGWYRVSQPELVAAGLSPRVNPHHLQLFVDGREQPIGVIGGKDGRFGPRDAIEFYGVGLDTPSTDTRVYWLVEGFKPGKRVELSHSQGGRIVSSSFPYTVQVKDQWIYLPAIKNGEEENFFGAVVYGSGVDQLLGAKDLDLAASEDALLEVALQGATSGTHRVKVLVNDEEVGEVVFESQSKGLLQVEVPQAFLREGDNLVSFIPLGGEMDVSLVDSIRLTYWHTYTADNNRHY
jgi:hypothetical protein